jgi:hypothetical protein
VHFSYPPFENGNIIRAGESIIWICGALFQQRDSRGRSRGLMSDTAKLPDVTEAEDQVEVSYKGNEVEIAQARPRSPDPETQVG